MSTDTSQRVFRQKLAYRWLVPTLTFCSLVVAIATTCLLLVESNSRIVANLCICAWLIVLVYGKPSLTVFTTIAVCEDGIQIHWLRGSRYIPFQDVVSIDVQRARRRLTIRTHLDVIYITPSYRDVGDLIDLLEIKIHTHLEVVPAKPKEKPERTGAVVLPRTFRRSRRLRVRTFLGVFVYLIPAAALTWFAVESSSLSLFTVAAVFWFFATFTLRDLLLLPSKLVVDQSAITYTGILGTTRIRYEDVVEIAVTLRVGLGGSYDFPYRQLAEFGATDKRGWRRLTVRSDSSRVICSDTFEGFDETVDLVLERVPQGALDGSASTEFECSLFYRNTFWLCFIFFSGILIWAVVSGLTQDHNDDFYGEVVFPIAGFGAFALFALFGALELSARVYLEDGRIVVCNWRGGAVIPYGQIVRVERCQPWYDEERVIITYAGGRLTIPGQLNRYDDFLSRLDEFVPVRWRGEDEVHLPLSWNTRGWISPLLYFLCGLFFAGIAAGPLLVSFRESGATGEAILYFAGFAGGLGGIWFSLYQLLRHPLKVTFFREELKMTMAWIVYRFSPHQIERVQLKESRERNITRRQVWIQIAGKTYVLSEAFSPVSLVPVYKLLCKTYWPEGYRDPEGSAIAGRTTSDSKE